MMIDPEMLFDGKRLRMCPTVARLYWPYFFVLSDSLGRFEIDCECIIARAFWSFKPQPSPDDVASMLGEYKRVGLLLVYEVDGQRWGQWNVTRKYLAGAARPDELSPAPPVETAHTGENVTPPLFSEMEAEQPAQPDPFESWFDNEFWPAYPRKVAKAAAKEKARAKGRTQKDRERIMAGLKRQLRDMTERERQFIPYPAAWLHQERYNDEPETQAPITRKSVYPEWNGYQG